MPIGDLIRAFENTAQLPVKLDDVKDWILKRNAQDEIEFIGVELDIGVIRGYLHKFTYRASIYGEPIMASNIYYASNQPEEWVNIVCCKELIHIIDGKNAISVKDKCEELFRELALPRDLETILQIHEHVLIDKFGDILAAVIFLRRRFCCQRRVGRFCWSRIKAVP